MLGCRQGAPDSSRDAVILLLRSHAGTISNGIRFVPGRRETAAGRIHFVQADGSAVGAHDPAVMALQHARVIDTAGMRHGADFLVHGDGVAIDALRLVGGNQPALQVLLVGRNAGWALIGVALQGLNAPERKHEAARGGHEVSAGAKSPGHAGRCGQLAGRNDLDAVAQTMHQQRVYECRQALLDLQADIVDQGLRGCPRAAVGAIKRDEVRRALNAAPVDLFAQAGQPAIGPQHHLDACRLAGDLSHMGDEIQQLADRVDLGMPVGADRVLANLDPTDLGDFLADLFAGKNTALAWFRSLAELDLKHLHLVTLGDPAQLVVVERAIIIAHAIFGGADLEDDVAATLNVKRGQSAFTGIHPDACPLGATGESLHGGFRDGAVAHTGDMEELIRCIGRFAVGTNGHFLGGDVFVTQLRERTVDEDLGAHMSQRPGGAKGDSRVHTFCSPIDPGALCPVERQFCTIVSEKILTEVLAQILGDISKSADHGIVAANGVFCLRAVNNIERENGEKGCPDQENKERGKQADDIRYG